jgi:hypothetical protein
MRALLLLLVSSLLLSCAGAPSGSSPRPRMKPAECMHCGNTGTKMSLCEGPYLNCTGSCAGGDPNNSATCNGTCFTQHSECMALAALDDRPVYCK